MVMVFLQDSRTGRGAQAVQREPRPTLLALGPEDSPSPSGRAKPYSPHSLRSIDANRFEREALSRSRLQTRADAHRAQVWKSRPKPVRRHNGGNRLYQTAVVSIPGLKFIVSVPFEARAKTQSARRGTRNTAELFAYLFGKPERAARPTAIPMDEPSTVFTR